MKQEEGKSEIVNQTEETQAALICGLPDDIAFFCLARVPRTYHAVLKCVSRRWRDLVCSEEFCAYRRKHSLHETQIYALCRDKLHDRICLYVLDPNSSRRSWKRMHEHPPCKLRRKGMGFEVLSAKLYLLGGCRWSEDATDKAYCYNASTNKWLKISPLSTERCYMASEVLDGKIFVVGGLGLKPSVSQSWDTYDPSTNTWKSNTDPNIVPEIDDSFVMDGKIYIRSGGSSTTSHVYALVYEQSSATWRHVDDEMASGWRGPAVVVDGNLYVLDESSGTTFKMWRKETREWIRVGRLSQLFIRPPCRLVPVGKSIFVIGKGLRTSVIDVGNIMDGIGFLMCSSIRSVCNDDIDVISCKCLSI